jgi:hypothetical protein
MIAALEAADAAALASESAPIAKAIAAAAPTVASATKAAGLGEQTGGSGDAVPASVASIPAPSAAPVALEPTASASAPAPTAAPIAAEPEKSPAVVASAISPSESSSPSQSSSPSPAPAVTEEIRFVDPAPQTPVAPRTAARTVSAPRGSSLSLLMMNIYGEYNGDLLHTVRTANPEITDPDFILAGQEIRFPKPQTIAAPQADRSQDHE